VTAGARYAVIIGDTEAASGNFQLKDLASGQQQSVTLLELISIASPQ